jgi:hypothetical protein
VLLADGAANRQANDSLAIGRHNARNHRVPVRGRGPK